MLLPILLALLGCLAPADCDAPVFYCPDDDRDGYGGGTTAADGVEACAPPSGYALGCDDCDDGDPETYPGAPEECGGEDRDCSMGTSGC